MTHLTPEEQALLEAFEADEFRSVDSSERRRQFLEAAHATGLKDQRINIRLARSDLQELRARALREGVPYQTLISSVLHRYVSGRLREV